MPGLVRIQARVPSGADVLPNEHGTAPGLHLEHEGRHVFLLPGPPRELHPMYDASVEPWLRRLVPGAEALRCIVLRTLGVGESLAQELVEATVRRECPGVSLGYCARSGEVDIRLIAEHDAAAVARAADIGEGTDTLETSVIRLATAQGWSLAVAESCTGGLLAHRLTNVPGASAVFLGGAVTYANEEKTRQLGVPPALLAEHGAVSGPVAEAMARGLAERSGASLVVTTTGIAGPGGGSAEKPVGTLWLGLCSRGEVRSFQRRLAQERETFKFMASQAGLDLMRRTLAGLPVE
jgi:nicotinamide-nucleotide amidase